MLAGLIRRLLPQAAPPASAAAAMQAWQRGDAATAETLCRALLAVSPTDADAHALLALIAEQKGEFGAALRSIDTALLLHEEEAGFHLMRSRLLGALDRVPESVASLERLLQLLPRGDLQRVPALLALFTARQADDGRAEDHLREALAIAPENPQILEHLGNRLYQDSRTAEARTLLRRYCFVKPGYGPRIHHALAIPVISAGRDEIAAVRTRLHGELEQIASERLAPMESPEIEIGTTAFYLAYHALNDRPLMEALARAVRAGYPTAPPAPAPRKPGKRIRIGFVSTFFYNHSITRTTIGHVLDLPRERFEVWVFSIAPKADESQAAMRAACDHYVQLPNELARARTAISDAGLDILFYADIGMHPTTYYLAYWRLAPVQMMTWGHPVTSGLDTIDYFVSSSQIEADAVDTEADAQYSEKLLRLPGYFQPRYRRVARPAARARADLGLRDDATLYVCLQNLFKLHPDFDQALGRILQGDPRAQVVLLQSHPHWASLVRDRLERSIGAAAARVMFVPRMQHAEFLGTLALADVVLDPFHFGGNNSNCEAFALGKPVVTLPSEFVRGRFTLGMYREMGIDTGIARDPGHYVDIALRLGRDADERQACATLIEERAKLLFDRSDATAALAVALEDIMERHPLI